MLKQILKSVFGTKNDRDLARMRPRVARINALEEEMACWSDEALRERTAAWKAELAAIPDRRDRERRLDALLPEAFAVVKSACRRMTDRRVMVPVLGQALVWDMIPFDVQLLGGIALHGGRVAEMATGEGKTLVATLPAYLNALAGLGVHVVTVNEYLAARDSAWMGALHGFLGLTVGCLRHDQPPALRRAQYQADITYGTNSEFGFDYLRDQGSARRLEDQVQRGHAFAIVDEADSILIDDARTPLIISGPSAAPADDGLLNELKPAIRRLVESQERLCRGFLREAREALEELDSDGRRSSARRSELERRIGLLLFRVRLGTPRLPEWLEFLGMPGNARRLADAEHRIHADPTKELFLEQKESLFFAVDEKSREADLTEKGRQALQPKDPDAFLIPDIGAWHREIDGVPGLDARARSQLKEDARREYETRTRRIHVIAQLLKAYCLYERDVHYLVHEGKVVIVDEHTGRALPGRRWNDGLHQAVEAKEGVEIERETRTHATITIQNYFRLYGKLSGMTGTAESGAQELHDIYRLGLLVIPPHRPCLRQDAPDLVFRTRREKWDAVVQEIAMHRESGRPVLVGTVSIEASEHLSGLLERAGIAHALLNAKHPRQEAEIVARAGLRGAVTIATNMAGRGTDIKLGPGVAELGGLHVIGTERHESRRVDRQLRGRCSRQGDPGSSRFFLSLEDDLLRLFGSGRLVRHLSQARGEPGRPLDHPLLARTVERAQSAVEQHQFQIRKRTLEFDDVLTRQREIVYGLRNEVLAVGDVRERLLELVREGIAAKARECFDPSRSTPGHEPVREFVDWAARTFPIALPESWELATTEESGAASEAPEPVFAALTPPARRIATRLHAAVVRAHEVSVGVVDEAILRSLERRSLLAALDRPWQEHLSNMDSLRGAISLRAYGQRDPLLEYKSEAFQLFADLMNQIRDDACKGLFSSTAAGFLATDASGRDHEPVPV